MRLSLAASLLILLPLSALEAQTPRTTIRVGGGASWVDFTCGTCDLIQDQSGFTAFAAATRPFGRLLSGGLEVAVSDVKLDGRAGGNDDVRLLGALATAGITTGSRVPLWSTLGLGWIWYNGVGPNSSGPALSLRVGFDLPVAGSLALSPFAGLLTMVGHDGPHHVANFPFDQEGEATRVSSLHLGLATALRF